jgi:outer membrane lipoprotein LolB
MQVLCGFLLLSSLFLSGCASLFGIADANKLPVYHKPMYIKESYAINGRFSINSNTTHKYGNFTWVKTSTNEEINFNTPLGQTVAKITIESGIVTLTTKEHTYVGNDVDDMLYDNIGFDLPVNYLHYWVEGLPLPNTEVARYFTDGFEQASWKVEYLDWSTNNEPHLLKCTNKDLVVKLLINWN